jgi:hypothetical protein
VINEWREGVRVYLNDTFTNVEVVSGERDGVWRGETDLITVWWPGWDEIARDITLAAPQLIIRWFPNRSVVVAPDAPADPTDLEKAADALIDAFDRTSEQVGFFVPDLSCRLTSVKPNYDTSLWRVEATLLAFTVGVAA